jgi:hypothetical protein
MAVRHQLTVIIEAVEAEDIDAYKDDGNKCIIGAVSQKGLFGGSQEMKPLAVKDECGDIPAHDKNTQRNACDETGKKIHLAKVFRGQQQRVRAKTLHQGSVKDAEKKKPYQQEHLVFPEMKNK